MSENRISIEFSQAELDAINDAIAIINSKLAPKLIALEADDKKALAKIGERSLPFVEKCVQYAESNPEFLPFYVSAVELKKDFTAFSVLKNLLRPLSQLIGNIDDTATLCGSEAINDCSSYYGSVREASQRGVPNAKPIYDDLSIRYEAQKARRKPSPAP